MLIRIGSSPSLRPVSEDKPARAALVQLMEAARQSVQEPLRRRAGTGERWFEPLVRSMRPRSSHGRTEGFPNTMKLIQRMAAGLRHAHHRPKRLLASGGKTSASQHRSDTGVSSNWCPTAVEAKVLGVAPPSGHLALSTPDQPWSPRILGAWAVITTLLHERPHVCGARPFSNLHFCVSDHLSVGISLHHTVGFDLQGEDCRRETGVPVCHSSSTWQLEDSVSPLLWRH